MAMRLLTTQSKVVSPRSGARPASEGIGVTAEMTNLSGKARMEMTLNSKDDVGKVENMMVPVRGQDELKNGECENGTHVRCA